MKSGKRTANYPMGSVSCATMREEDLIPTFCYELQQLARQTGILPAKTRREHAKLAREIERRIENETEFEDKVRRGEHERERRHERRAFFEKSFRSRRRRVGTGRADRAQKCRQRDLAQTGATKMF